METFITFLTILSIAGVAISAFIILLYLRAEHSLNNTKAGELRKLLANLDNKTLYVEPVGTYVIILVVSATWLIASFL